MISYLDRYARGATVCHRWPASLKLLLAFAVTLTSVLLPHQAWPAQGVLACFVFAGHSLAGIPFDYLLRRLLAFAPLVMMMSLALPLSQGFAAGWEVMLSILCRSGVAFLAGLWLINVMPFDQLLFTLHRFGMPKLLVAMLAFMYRYVFVLWDEYDRMQTARSARDFGGGSAALRWRIRSQLIGMLLIRSMSRAERVHGAMCARGWDGTVRVFEIPPESVTRNGNHRTI